MLYNVPTRTGCDLLTETVVRLAAFDNIVAVKDATGNLVRGSELVAAVGDKMAVLSGDDGTTFPLYACGGRVISVVSNVAPRAMSDMWDAASKSELGARAGAPLRAAHAEPDALRRAEPRSDEGRDVPARPLRPRGAPAARRRDAAPRGAAPHEELTRMGLLPA